MFVTNRHPGRLAIGWTCPPYFPDLNSCDCFMWGFLKDNVYRNNYHTVEEMKEIIIAVVEGMTEDIMTDADWNYRKFQPTSANNIGCTEIIYSTLVHLNKKLPTFTCCTILDSLMSMQYFNKYRHLKLVGF